MRRRLRSHRRPEPADINITAFMNLMVILVPFLLITAVFSRITILELNLPAAGDPALAATERFELEVIVRADRIEVGDRKGGLFQQIPATESGDDYEQLSQLLQQIKVRYPDKLDATLARLRSQRDVLKARLLAVRARQGMEGGRRPTRVVRAVMACRRPDVPAGYAWFKKATRYIC